MGTDNKFGLESTASQNCGRKSGTKKTTLRRFSTNFDRSFLIGAPKGREPDLWTSTVRKICEQISQFRLITLTNGVRGDQAPRDFFAKNRTLHGGSFQIAWGIFGQDMAEKISKTVNRKILRFFLKKNSEKSQKPSSENFEKKLDGFFPTFFQLFFEKTLDGFFPVPGCPKSWAGIAVQEPWTFQGKKRSGWSMFGRANRPSKKKNEMKVFNSYPLIFLTAGFAIFF